MLRDLLDVEVSDRRTQYWFFFKRALLDHRLSLLVATPNRDGADALRLDAWFIALRAEILVPMSVSYHTNAPVRSAYGSIVEEKIQMRRLLRNRGYSYSTPTSGTVPLGTSSRLYWSNVLSSS
jgi:hypothetical protein